MAIISASAQFILRGLDFSSLRNSDAELDNNIYETFKGKKYEDVLVLRNDDDSGANFAGKGFRLDSNDNALGGRVQVVQGVGPGDNNLFDIRGLDIGLKTADKAIGTRSFADDLKIWKNQFSGKDKMVLSQDNDNMRGFGGNDVMKGRAGNDKLSGDGGKDKIFGGDGSDKIYGGKGKDALRGGEGNDKISGGKGGDKLYGDGGDDILKGGGGADVFVFGKSSNDGSANWDVVRDFTIGTDMIKMKSNDDAFSDLSYSNNEDGDVVVSYSHGHFTLKGVSDTDLTDDMFLF